MIIWLNGAFGSGKTTCAFELQRRVVGSYVYDPEKIGFFLQNNLPKKIHQNDFQDYPEWRLFNYKILKKLAFEHEKIIIVPMTLTNKKYYDEIIQALLNDNIPVKHFILYASKANLIKRQHKRFEYKNSWAAKQIESCIYAFDNIITENKILTDNKTIDEIIEEVALKSGLELTNDNRSLLKKRIDRIIISLKHIR